MNYFTDKQTIHWNYTVVCIFTSICSQAPCNCLCYRELLWFTRPCFTYTSVYSQHSLAVLEIALWCVSGCCFDTDRPSWVAPEESSNKPEQTNRQKHCRCQKWHNEDNESTSFTVELLNVVCGHETWLMSEISSPDLCNFVVKETKQSVFIDRILSQMFR